MVRFFEGLSMSYRMLHHGNKSSHALHQLDRSPSTPTGSDSDSEDDHLGLRGGDGNFELNDFSHREHDSRDQDSRGSDEEEKRPEFGKHRRGSSSTVQSFMLYTPDEERSVIKKFDRRLVLFVALLYMLSFLDRSSMSGLFFPLGSLCFLMVDQILEMRGSLVCLKI